MTAPDLPTPDDLARLREAAEQYGFDGLRVLFRAYDAVVAERDAARAEVERLTRVESLVVATIQARERLDEVEGTGDEKPEDIEAWRAQCADFLERLPEADLAPQVNALLGPAYARPVVALDEHWRPVLGCPVGSGAACLHTADPCASFAAPICLDDSDCDSAATLINPGDYWACAVHATTRPGPWRLVGPVACESDMDRSCEGHWQAMRRAYNALLLEQYSPVALLVETGPAMPPMDRPALPVDTSGMVALLPRGADDMLGGWWPRG